MAKDKSNTLAILRRSVFVFFPMLSGAVTPMEEIVGVFDDLVLCGRILYAGLSRFPLGGSCHELTWRK